MRLLEQLRRGEEEVISSVIEAHLHRVMQLADKYRGTWCAGGRFDSGR